MKTTDDTDCTDGIRRARGPGWLMFGLVLGVVLMVGLGATVWTGYRSTNTLGTNYVALIRYDRGTSGVINAIHPTNFLTGLIALPNWPASGGTGEVSTAQLNGASNAVVAIVIANDTTTSNGLVTLLTQYDTTTSNALRTAFLAADITTSNGVVTLLQANDITTSNGVVAVLVANDTTTSNALRAAYLTADITTSNGVLAAAIANDMTMSNSFVKTIDTRGQTNSNARFTSTIFATGLSSNNTTVSTIGKTSSGELVETADYNLIFGNGTRAVTNGNDVTVELSLQVSNTLWFLSNIVVVANVTNATSGDVTNTISLAPGEVEYLAYETNATVRNTNFSGYVANTKSKWARYILTGPSAITATFNTGAVHGLYWGRNSNNIVDASMTLAANSRYLYSGSRWGSNILQSLIKVDQ
jgi:hypothetical protein